MTEPNPRYSNLNALEAEIAEAYEAASIVELLYEDMLGRAENSVEKKVHEQVGGFEGFRLCLLNDMQWRALTHAVYHASRKAQVAHQKYFAALEGRL